MIMTDKQIYSVSQVNRYIKGLLDDSKVLRNIAVQGEISNFKSYSSGHRYFSLKDNEGTISCVMFRSYAERIRFRPENGMKVIVMGAVSAYPRDGKYQLYCQQMMADGQGDLHLAFEQLKAKLEKEGLFDPTHKKPIPVQPRTIALITSGSGAAVRDMIRILKARWPMTGVKVMSVQVQGAEAPAQLTGAVRYANRWQVADLIIIGRGGGSMEDLWAFNDERLARAIYQSEIPIISAVGHEPDVVISDYVADLRASTPSNAAELAVPDGEEVREQLNTLEQRLQRAIKKQLQDADNRLTRCRESRIMADPVMYFREKQLRLDYLTRSVTQGFERILAAEKQRLTQAASALDAMSPMKVLGRGYSIVTTEDGTAVVSESQVNTGDQIKVQLARGRLNCEVLKRSSG